MKQVANESQLDRFLSFRLGDEGFAIELVNVVEIVPVTKMTPVPHSKAYAKGVMNLRGKVIPVLDLRIRFGMEERSYDDRTCVMILASEQDEVGLVVDRVIGVQTYTSEKVESLTSNSDHKLKKYFKGIAKTNNEILPVLDLEKVFYEKTNVIEKKLDN